MADRSLKGTGLGAKSFEDEAGVEFAARQEVGYDCPREHHFTLVVLGRGRDPVGVGVPAVRRGVAALRRRAARAQGGEAGADPLGHASRASLHRRAGGTAGGAAELAAFGRIGVHRFLEKHQTEENGLRASATTEFTLRASAWREQLPKNTGRLLVCAAGPPNSGADSRRWPSNF